MKINDLGIKIIYKPLKKIKGYWDERTGEIVINSKMSEEKQDAILIHEFMHLTATALKQMGIITRQPDHAFITNSCQQLLALFVASGKWHKKYNIKIKN